MIPRATHNINLLIINPFISDFIRWLSNFSNHHQLLVALVETLVWCARMAAIVFPLVFWFYLTEKQTKPGSCCGRKWEGRYAGDWLHYDCGYWFDYCFVICDWFAFDAPTLDGGRIRRFNEKWLATIHSRFSVVIVVVLVASLWLQCSHLSFFAFVEIQAKLCWFTSPLAFACWKGLMSPTTGGWKIFL